MGRHKLKPLRHNLRADKALQLRRSGLTFREIGIALGNIAFPDVPISIVRARQLVDRGLRQERAAAQKVEP